MSNKIIKTSEGALKITQQLNIFYRALGILLIVSSVYLLMHPVFTGKHIIYRSQIELTFFSVPGIVAGLLALFSKTMIFSHDKKIVLIKYMTLFIPLFKRVYIFTSESKLHLCKDDKDVPMYSNPSPNEMFSHHVVPWYLVSLVTGPNILQVLKTRNATKSKNIAYSIKKLTNIPVIFEENYPEKP